jgi:hypothetical protein
MADALVVAVTSAGVKTKMGFSFKFKILGRHEARVREHERHITVAVLAGRADHLVYCGTLTLAESEWDVLSSTLRDALGDAIEISG